MDSSNIREYLQKVLSEIAEKDGTAATDRFLSLRDVDAKIREVKIFLTHLYH